MVFLMGKRSSGFETAVSDAALSSKCHPGNSPIEQVPIRGKLPMLHLPTAPLAPLWTGGSTVWSKPLGFAPNACRRERSFLISQYNQAAKKVSNFRPGKSGSGPVFGHLFPLYRQFRANGKEISADGSSSRTRSPRRAIRPIWPRGSWNGPPGH
jgi:hypothetical protein